MTQYLYPLSIYILFLERYNFLFYSICTWFKQDFEL